MADLPSAYISHFTSGRLRVRIPSKKADVAYFASLKERLSKLPGVQAVEATPLTGSLLVHHSYDAKNADLKPMADYIEFSGLFKLQIPEQAGQMSVAEQLAGTMAGWNEQLKGKTNGAVDFQSLAFLGLVGASLLQASRGVIMIPAITALWYASSILKDMKTEREEGQTGQDKKKA